MSYFYELAGILPSLNEMERQMLVAKIGSIKKILKSTKTGFENFSLRKKCP